MPHRIRRALGTLLAAGLLGSGLVALDVPAAQAAYPVPPTPSGLPAAIEVLRPGGMLAIEVGQGQSRAVEALFERSGH